MNESNLASLFELLLPRGLLNNYILVFGNILFIYTCVCLSLDNIELFTAELSKWSPKPSLFST